MITIIEEGRQHAAAIEALLDRGFGADRRRKRSYFYRRGVPRSAGLCLVAAVVSASITRKKTVALAGP